MEAAPPPPPAAQEAPSLEPPQVSVPPSAPTPAEVVAVVEQPGPAPAPACSSGAPTKFFHTPTAPEVKEGVVEKKVKVQRRRLSPSHREMIIDLVFNEKKTSREVGALSLFVINFKEN